MFAKRLDPSAESLATVKSCYETGFKFVHAGLAKDEAGSPDIALYSQGVTEFRRGVGVVVNGNGANQEECRKMQGKMKKNIKFIEERMRELRTANVKQVQKASTPPSRPAAPATRKNVTKNVNINVNKNINRNVNVNSNDKAMVSKLKKGGIDNAMIERILDEVMESTSGIRFEDVIGHQQAKSTLKEMLILPAMRPDLFTGIRAPPKGLLLYGPPGNGKTLLAKALAAEMPDAKFFNISASSLTSKWVGDGEKMVRALFTVAREMQPCIIFMDEVDSLLSSRSSNEGDAVKRLKTEFLVQFDGAGTNKEDKVTIVAATNLPQELDEAVLRRFPKRIMLPPPDDLARQQLISHSLKEVKHKLSETEIARLGQITEGYSGSDLTQLVKEAALAPIRELSVDQVNKIKSFRPITFSDFTQAAKIIRPSTSVELLKNLDEWTNKYGAYS
ncbi:Oidioi.mRNA.OKI2018_I69.PAR.g11636.t1.cds [Oikopleura dioica]|uniref:microtubule-severing ATPase n=1 Tax=Oikopleura dioica TaxID=34765 RepID=A0ABN7RWQ6_OIKDI|nr:Oidioi.mRNA.OKI2018_I69.PAR.g11636.t1.cds [Oikopleura dioica]